MRILDHSFHGCFNIGHNATLRDINYGTLLGLSQLLPCHVVKPMPVRPAIWLDILQIQRRTQAWNDESTCHIYIYSTRMSVSVLGVKAFSRLYSTTLKPCHKPKINTSVWGRQPHRMDI